MPDVLPCPPLERIAFLFASICGKVADRGGRDHSVIPMVWLIWTRLRRMAKLLTALIDRFENGALPAKRPRARAKRPRDARAAELPPAQVPMGFGWLGQFAPEAQQFSGHVQMLLDDPRMLELLAAAPQAGRIMRPLCRMFSIPVPPAWKLPPRRKRPLAEKGRVKPSGATAKASTAGNPGLHRQTALSGPSPGMPPRRHSPGEQRRRFR